MIAATTCFIYLSLRSKPLETLKTSNLHPHLMQRPSARERPKALFNRTVLSLELNHKSGRSTKKIDFCQNTPLCTFVSFVVKLFQSEPRLIYCYRFAASPLS